MMKILSCTLLIVGVWTAVASGYQRTLTDEAIQSAIDHGRASKESTLLNEPYLYTIRNGTGLAVLSVETPWFYIANRSRAAAREYREFTLSDARRALATRAAGVHVVAVVVERTETDFWTDSHAVFIQNAVTVQPFRKTSQFGRVVGCQGGRPCEVQANMIFNFRDDTLIPTQDAELRLIIRTRSFKQ